MAEVWEAQHELSGREAVVKLLRPEMIAQDHLVKRFLQEARAAASIRDPGIVDIIDVGYSVDGRAYLILEKLEGETLAQRVKARGTLSVNETAIVIRQLARIMAAAHAKGIVHCDLKPENIFLVHDPEVAGGERIKVLDFGLAKLAQAAVSIHTAKGTVVGTPAYMAPEQCHDSANVDHRADLYAIGCIFYRCLCGRPPFGTGGIEVLRDQIQGIAVPPRCIRPDIPFDLETVILKLLTKDPNARMSSCNQLLAALDELQESGVLDAWAGSRSGIPIPLDPADSTEAGEAVPAIPDNDSEGEDTGPHVGPRSRVALPLPQPADGATIRRDLQESKSPCGSEGSVPTINAIQIDSAAESKSH